MTAKGIITKLMLATLVVLPISGAAVFIAVFAKDALEVASALIAGAVALVLASLLQMGLMFRDMRMIGLRQVEARQHALALARCMKDLTARIGALENGDARQDSTVPPVPAPVQAANDQQLIRPAAPPPARLTPAPPLAVTHVPALAAPPPPPPLSERRYLTLPQRRLAGTEIITAPSVAADDPFLTGFQDLSSDGCMLEKIEAAARLIGEAVRPDGTFILVAAVAGLDHLPASVDRMLALAADEPEFAARFLLGLSQQSVRTGGAGQAQALARLARAGLCFILTDVRDTRLDARALKACNITHVRFNARQLIEAALRTGSDLATLTGRLAAGGITLIAEGVDEARLIPELIDLSVPLAEGPALSRTARGSATPAPVTLPVRPALPDEAPPALFARPEDSVRYRAAG